MSSEHQHAAALEIVSASVPDEPPVNAPPVSEAFADQAIATLTRDLARGDDDAFREFHRLYFDRLFRLALVLCRGQEPEARDALQEVFCRVARYGRRFEREEVFWCWLVAVTRSAVLDAGRKRHRYWKLLTDYAQRWLPVQTLPDADHDHAIEALLVACLDELDSADRALVEGKYLSRRSTSELALETGLTERAVESRLFRLRQLLRKRLLLRLRKDP
jgi:RNA polymerase sigma-70 factor (ECF subfamily)